jgi:hypothetical protein
LCEVLDDKRLTFEGQPATWNNLETFLAAVPHRERTVLEWAVPSTQITIQQQNEWASRFADLARKHGFEYSSYVGFIRSDRRVVHRPPNATDSPHARGCIAVQRRSARGSRVDGRQFRSFFDSRTFDGWSDEERAALERKLMDALHGPRSTEYYQAINTLAALRSTKALPRLREIASERVDRNNRDRWMAIRALGIIGDRESVPELIHLVYHGNVNTLVGADSLVRITGQNFAKDWSPGQWWNGKTKRRRSARKSSAGGKARPSQTNSPRASRRMTGSSSSA